MDKQGIFFVVSAPSGAGKTSLCQGVMKEMENLKFSVSHTTRLPRVAEVDGQDYFFVDETYFKKGIKEGEFIEWAEVHGHLYGTSRKRLKSYTSQGIDVILDVDTQGAMKLQASSMSGVYIYVLPPSFDILKKRLNARAADSDQEIARRFQQAGKEILFYNRYQYLIVNEVFETAKKDLKTIILAERLRIRKARREWVEERFIHLL